MSEHARAPVDRKIVRVSVDQLRRVLGKRLARPLVEDCVAELEASPEGEIPRGKPSDEARTLARMDFGPEARRKRA